jgi:DNA adenine methylase
MRAKKSSLQPFLKWTGGKSWAVHDLESFLPATYGRYFEPFLGGGAFFFHFQPYPATLTDINADLVNAYRQVRDNCDEVISRLQRMPISKERFLIERAKQPRTRLTKAVRFLYLNRTAYNGMFRVNQRGQFNVPFGCKEGTILCDAEHLRRISSVLKNRSIHATDFEEVIDKASTGDVVFADPPYTTKHNNNGFRRYNENLFTWPDQERLAAACLRASKRGVIVIVSNADHSEVCELYKSFFSVTRYRYSSIAATKQNRGKVSERIFSSTPSHDSY